MSVFLSLYVGELVLNFSLVWLWGRLCFGLGLLFYVCFGVRNDFFHIFCIAPCWVGVVVDVKVHTKLKYSHTNHRAKKNVKGTPKLKGKKILLIYRYTLNKCRF